MTPILYAKIAGIGVIAALLLGIGWHFGGLSGKLEASNAKTALASFQEAQAANTAKAVLAERASAAAAAITDNNAENAHDKTIESLPARIVHDPVFLREPGDICPAVSTVPDSKGQTASDDSAGRSTEQRSGIDLRPAIEAFKIKYETVLADCRRLDSEWPK
jgi:hypothetical protein